MTSAHSRLLAAWGLLLGLTFAAGIAAAVTAGGRLGSIALVAIGVLTLAKVRIILIAYLGLARGSGALNGMLAMVALTLAIVIGSFLVVPTPPPA